jgi:hypothetical protein
MHNYKIVYFFTVVYFHEQPFWEKTQSKRGSDQGGKTNATDISDTVDKWIIEEAHHGMLALKVVRQNDPGKAWTIEKMSSRLQVMKNSRRVPSTPGIPSFSILSETFFGFRRPNSDYLFPRMTTLLKLHLYLLRF